MTLKEAKAYMISNPMKKITCQYFQNEWEWIMFNGKEFVFEDGYSPDLFWWNQAYGFNTDWWEITD